MNTRGAIALLTAALALTLAACGSGSSGGQGSSGGAGGRQGGSITIGTVGPDSYDPVEFQTLQAQSALHLVYTPLVTYPDTTGPASGDLVPGMAERVPTPTNGGRTYVFTLRKGARYSDGTPARASDFTHVVKRLLFLAGPYSSFFGGIVGADAYVKAKNPNAPLRGIVADDATRRITVTLTAPDTSFLYAVALTSAGLTPARTSPFKDLTGTPPPGDGPYTLRIVDPSPTSGQFVLTRNPKFDVPGLAKGHLDKITGMVSSNANQMAENVIQGRYDYMTEDPTGDLLPQIQARYGDRFKLDANPPNTYFFFLNTTVAPFDRPAARQAVNLAVDSRALQRIFGGRLRPTCGLLPPGVPGFDPNRPCPWGPPGGPADLAKARQLVQSAGLAGTPVTVWTNSKDPRPAIGDYLRSTLSQIGFKADLKTLDPKVYFQTVGSPSTKAQIGFSNWYQDFPHPGDFFGTLLAGSALRSTPTTNQGFVNDPQVNATIAQLQKLPPKQAAGRWAALDALVNSPSKAYLVPYGNEEASTFMSSRMDFQHCSGGPHVVYRNDWALFCLK